MLPFVKYLALSVTISSLMVIMCVSNNHDFHLTFLAEQEIFTSKESKFDRYVQC